MYVSAAAASAAARKRTLGDPGEAIVYEVWPQMYETHRVGDAAYAQAVKALGLPQVVGLIATIGYYSLVSMTLNAFEVGLPSGERSLFPD